jgi:DNA invertase Pin-like site-specific DNA recombinase
MFRAGLYARVSTNDQPTLAMQNQAMREHAGRARLDACDAVQRGELWRGQA